MARTKRLGKGLDALLTSTDPDTDSPSDGDQTVTEIPVAEISPNPHQPRTVFDDERLSDLTESIRQHGLVQPVVVREDGNGYQLVAGERRWRASQRAGLETIPAIVRTFNEAQMLEIALIENLQREDLNPIEQARAFQTLIKKFGLTQAELADRVGKSRSQISNTLRLLNLCQEVQALVADGSLAMGHARLLVPLEETVQLATASRMIDGEWSVREAEQRVKAMRTGETVEDENQVQQKQKEADREARASGKRKDPQVEALQEQVADYLGTPVKIRLEEDGSGQMMIRFYDREGLVHLSDRLLSLTGGF